MYASEKDYWKKKYPWQYPSGDLHPDQRQAYLDSYHNASTRAALLPQDGYLSGGQFAEEAKLDGRKLSKGETLDRLNPIRDYDIGFDKGVVGIHGGGGWMNQQEYRDKYNPDGSLRNPPFSMMDYLNPAQASLPQEPQTKPALDTSPQGAVPNEELPVEVAQPALSVEDTPEGNDQFVPPTEELPFDKNGILQGIGDSLAEDDGTGSATNNSRSHTATAEEIKAKKEADDRRNEMLIRVGGAIVGASGRGGLAAIDAGTKEYGRLADYQRAQEQLEKENALAKQQKLDGLSATERKANQEAYNEVQTTITNNTQKIATFEGYIDALDRYGDGVTGPIIDKLGGKYIDAMTPGGEGRTMLRLGLEEVAVDKALQKIAQTKGAISDREMKLFLKPTPKLWMDEGVWKLYLQIEVETAKIINARLAGAKNADGTLVNRIDADREMDSKLKALYDQYMGLHGAQKAPDSDIPDDNDELFNF
jgi:uncharacterized protein YnzC (UPF0291/DUF896 family)